MSSLAELLARQSIMVVEATIPADMTIAEWRRSRTQPPRGAGHLRRLRRIGRRPHGGAR